MYVLMQCILTLLNNLVAVVVKHDKCYSIIIPVFLSCARNCIMLS